MMRLFVRTVLAIAAAVVLTVSCQTNVYYQNEMDRFDTFTSPSSLILIYGIGHNNLSSYLNGNLVTLCKNPLPQRGSDKVLLAFMSLSSGGDRVWKENDKSYLIRLSTSASKVYRDTLLTIEGGRKASDPDVIKEVLGYVRNKFKVERYGLILSSHGSGWLPAGYVQPIDVISWLRPHDLGGDISTTVPLGRIKRLASLPGPLTKSFGMDCFGTYGADADSYELTIETLASSIEDRWNFILFDACFMGCVEVAYELRNCADKLCVSAAEVLATGFNYAKLTRLMFKTESSAEAFCKAYFDYYNIQQAADHRTATVATVATDGMDNLADVCRELIDKYSTAIADVDTNAVQVYSRGGAKWFCDLQDIFTESGISQEDSLKLQAALDGCIIYKAATPYILAQVPITDYCGLSMYLPRVGNAVLDAAYKRTAWNKAVNLVRE